MMPSKEQILERNRLEYDDAADPYWRLTVYDAFHDGWWFANIGGRHVLDALGRFAGLGPGKRVLELCSGLADTCRYLASAFGCEVTGIEMNRYQVEQGRQRLETCDPQAAGRVRLLEGDVLEWRPDELYDAVCAFDSLMLLEDRQGALRTASAALRPGGRALFADVLAGPNFTPRVERHIWEEDGILNLPTPGQQRDLLLATGFVDVELLDLTPLGVACFDAMVRASEAHRPVLVDAKGEERYESWLRNCRFYREAFGERALVYTQISGVKPGA
jgi:SAM-dependent methyltransferase